MRGGRECWGTLINPGRPLLKGDNNVTPISGNLLKVKRPTQGHMGTKWQGWTRTQEHIRRGLGPAQHQTVSCGGPGAPCLQRHSTRRLEVGGAPRIDGRLAGTLLSLLCSPSGSLSAYQGPSLGSPSRRPHSVRTCQPLRQAAPALLPVSLWNEFCSLCTLTFSVGKSRPPWCSVLTSPRQGAGLGSSVFPVPDTGSSTQ